MCTQLSIPLTVQIGLNQPSMKAHPIGQVVKFSKSVKIYAASLRGVPFMDRPTGSAMMVARIMMRLRMMKRVWNLPMYLFVVEARVAWIMTVATKTP
jgi:hypothetical protein